MPQNYHSLAKIATLALIFILPFFPLQLDPKINYLIYLYALISLPVFLPAFKNRLLKKDILTILFLIFLLSATISTIFSINLYQSLPELLLFYSYFVIFLATQTLFKNLKDKQILAEILVFVSVVLSGIALFNTLILHYVNLNRIGTSFYWIYYGHNHLSALLLFAIPLTFYFLKTYWHDKTSRIFLLLTFSFLLLSLYFTFARGAVAYLTLAFLISLILFKLAPVKIVTFGILGTILLLVITLNDLKINARLFKVNREGWTSSSRDIYFQKAIDNWKMNPLVGTGLDTFRFSKYPQSQKKILKSDFTHNFFLQMLSDAGILGFLSGFALILGVIWISFKKVLGGLQNSQGHLNYVFFVGLLASILNTVVDYDWQLPTVFLVFWIIASLLPENLGT